MVFLRIMWGFLGFCGIFRVSGDFVIFLGLLWSFGWILLRVFVWFSQNIRVFFGFLWFWEEFQGFCLGFSQGFVRLSQGFAVFWGFCGVFSVFLQGFPGFLWDFLRFLVEFLRILWGFLGSLWGFLGGYCGGFCKEFVGFLRDFVVFSWGFCVVFLGFCRVFSDFFGEKLRKLWGFHKLLFIKIILIDLPETQKLVF